MRRSVIISLLLVAAGWLSAFAAAHEKGGEDETGPYDLVANWPQPFPHAGYTWGSISSVMADSPERILVGMRGQHKIPDKVPATFDGSWGSLGLDQRATVPPAEMRDCIFVLDGRGKLVESWTQWDHLFEYDSGGFGGPHTVKISPYDPERHVWVINELKHEIYEFTNDGKRLVKTLGERGVAGDDQTHFGRPQDLAWLPDGTMLVADGLVNARIVKLDNNGKFLKAWGTKGSGPGQLSGPHAIAVDRNRRAYVADRGNHRIQVFDEDGNYLDTWPNLRQPDGIHIASDQTLWLNDGVTGRFLKYDLSGKLLSWWGVAGTFSGAHWELHTISIDADGNLYTADSFAGRVQKFRPKSGVARKRLVGPFVQATNRR
jgi:hypothetical protein